MPTNRRPRYVTAIGVVALTVPCFDGGGNLTGYRAVAFDRNGVWKCAAPFRESREAADRDRRGWFASHRKLARRTARGKRKRGEG